MLHNQWSILKGTSGLGDIKKKKRNTLFFGKYEYCATAEMREAFVLRHRDHAVMDRVLDRRREWGRRMAQQPGSWMWSRLDMTEDDIKNLHTALDWILNQRDSIKVTVSGNWLHVYTQEQSLAEQVSALPGMLKCSVARADLLGDPAAVNLRHSVYQNRTYFRWTAVTLPQKLNLRSMLRAQTDIRMSPGLDWWLGDNKNLHLYDHHFIDHNDSGVLTLLALSLGRIVRKTLPIKTY